MTKGRPCSAIKLQAGIEDDRGCQNELEPVDTGEIERGDAPMRHRDQKDRHGEHDGKPEFSPELLILLFARGLFRINRRLLVALYLADAITELLNRKANRSVVGN